MTGNKDSKFNPFDLEHDAFDSPGMNGRGFQAASSNTNSWNEGSYSQEDSSEYIIRAQEDGIDPGFLVDENWDNDESDESVSSDRKKMPRIIAIAAAGLLVVGGVTTFVVVSGNSQSDKVAVQEVKPESSFEYVTPDGYLNRPEWTYKADVKPEDILTSQSGKFTVIDSSDSTALVIDSDTGKPRKDKIVNYSGKMRSVIYGQENAVAVSTSEGWTIVTDSGQEVITENADQSILFSGERMYRVTEGDAKGIFPVTPKSVKAGAPLIRAEAPVEGMIPVTFNETSVTWGSASNGGSLVTSDYAGKEVGNVVIAPPASGYKPKKWGSVFGTGQSIYMVWSNAEGNTMISTNSVDSGKLLASEKFTMPDDGIGNIYVSQNRNLFVIGGHTLINSETGLIYPVSKAVTIVSTFGDTFYIKDGDNKALLRMGKQTPAIKALEPENVNVRPIGLSGDKLIVSSKEGLSLHQSANIEEA